MKRTTFCLLSAAVFTWFVAGCRNVETFDYANSPGSLVRLQPAGLAHKTVTVLPFLDQRGTKYFDPMQANQAAAHPAGDHGSFYLGFLPLIPGGFVEKEEPENSVDFVSMARYHFDLPNDLAAAAELSLKNSQLFQKVVRSNQPKTINTDYVWRGIVTNTYYSGTIFSYGLTYLVSPVLWVLGAPLGVSENEFWVTFELVDAATGKVVWNYQYRGRNSLLHWIYAHNGEDCTMYPQLMKQAMNGALYELYKKFN